MQKSFFLAVGGGGNASSNCFLSLVWDTFYVSVTGGIPGWLETFWTVYINIVTWGSLILTVVSLIDYMKNNWSVMGNQF